MAAPPTARLARLASAAVAKSNIRNAVIKTPEMTIRQCALDTCPNIFTPHNFDFHFMNCTYFGAQFPNKTNTVPTADILPVRTPLSSDITALQAALSH
jgi:hypothetical protein